MKNQAQLIAQKFYLRGLKFKQVGSRIIVESQKYNENTLIQKPINNG